MVYSAELAPPGWEGRHASWIVAFAQGGLFAGEVAVMMGGCQYEAFKSNSYLFGWGLAAAGGFQVACRRGRRLPSDCLDPTYSTTHKVDK